MTNDELLYNAKVATNICYSMIDVMESAMLDMNTLLSKTKFKLTHEDKRNFNTAIAALKRLKQNVDRCSEHEQEAYGDDADMMYQVIKLIIDRVGEDNNKLYQFYNYIKSFPSALNLDLCESERVAFDNLNR